MLYCAQEEHVGNDVLRLDLCWHRMCWTHDYAMLQYHVMNETVLFRDASEWLKHWSAVSCGSTALSPASVKLPGEAKRCVCQRLVCNAFHERMKDLALAGPVSMIHVVVQEDNSNVPLGSWWHSRGIGAATAPLP